MTKLQEHKELCQKLLSYFQNMNGVTGAFISGSGASGNMDFYSDLDLGFVCSNETMKEKIWSERFNWNLPPWFHRMDADHVKPYFIIYLFEPHIHVDLAFYTKENLPPQAGGPFVVAFDKENQLGSWLKTANEPFKFSADWSNVVHDEERFWTWIHYAWGHVGRGEYYDIASQFEFLRKIPHLWYARLEGDGVFETRRLEQRGQNEFIGKMKLSFPAPSRESLKSAFLNLIEVHNHQRNLVEKLLNPKWTTNQPARDKITRLVEDL